MSAIRPSTSEIICKTSRLLSDPPSLLSETHNITSAVRSCPLSGQVSDDMSASRPATLAIRCTSTRPLSDPPALLSVTHNITPAIRSCACYQAKSVIWYISLLSGFPSDIRNISTAVLLSDPASLLSDTRNHLSSATKALLRILAPSRRRGRALGRRRQCRPAIPIQRGAISGAKLRAVVAAELWAVVINAVQSSQSNEAQCQ